MPNEIKSARDALERLVEYLDSQIARARKCDSCQHNGKTWRGEPCYWHVDCGVDENDCKARENAEWLLRKFALRDALALPRRNCEAVTPEEQAQRFGKLCDKYYDDEYPCNKECPLASLPMIHGFPRCQAYWSQMPYEAEEEGGAR